MMIRTHIYWRGEISAAHHLTLPYPSKCTEMHGHNYLIEVWVYGPATASGMVIDFSHIKAAVEPYDHALLNAVLAQPTAEALAERIASSLARAGIEAVRVRAWEDRDSYAEAEWTP
jgi:6-pyruvoyltetrahydropterin/6-carboxytetrahydropterin synthase